MASPFIPREVKDVITAFPEGVNMGVSPLLLDKHQLAQGTNITLRGTLVQPRPPFQKITIDFGYPAASQAIFESGKFQGACYFKPDNGFESLVCQINGHLFQITPGATTASFLDVTVPGDPNPVTPNQAWLWQAEKWVIVNDGGSVPIFFDQTATPMSRRSTWNTQLPFTTTVTTAFVAPAVGSAVLGVIVGDTTNMTLGGSITFKNGGNYLVQNIVSVTKIDIVNLTGVTGKTVPAGTVVEFSKVSTELPPGAMGAYGQGQNWFALPDLRQFTASDQVGDSSGTQANDYRDAVLNISRNLFLAGGGNFVVPGVSGEIRAFAFVPTLDASLGQGPLQCITPNFVFSVNVPPDVLTWQSLTNPILPANLVSYGGLGQWSSTVANADLIMRSVDGLRSLALARRDFNTWGATPISREVDPIVTADPQALLPFVSTIVFDNRILMTAQPVVSPGGVYWKQIIALNLDPVSSLRGKAPSIYDGSWTGINVLQLLKGQFSGVERAFAFTYNTTSQKIELYEIYETAPLDPIPKPLGPQQGFFDNGTQAITSIIRTPVMLKEVPGKGPMDLCRLIDGEIWVDSLQQTVEFQVFYRPDSYPCWVPWHGFGVCAPLASDDPNAQPGYRTRFGLGEPSGVPCEQSNNRPFRVGYWFQFKIVATGPFRFLGMQVKAVTEPDTQYAKIGGCCLNESQLKIPSGTTPQ